MRFLFQFTPLGYENTKTALCGHSENHWVKLFFALFSSVREKLQFTVFLDHPVVTLLNHQLTDWGNMLEELIASKNGPIYG